MTPINVKGHQALLFDKNTVILCIKCPWPEPESIEAITDEEKAFVLGEADKVVAYLLEEGIMEKNAVGGLGMAVVTKHPKTDLEF